jgi:hypothetical protein
MRYEAIGRRKIFGGGLAIATALGMLVLPATVLANAANPDTTTVDQVVVNQDGSRTVTVEGTWTWQTQSKCATARNGVGYQVDWFDNQTNAIGSAKDPNGILYVGDAQDNIVHSDESLGQSTAFGNAFWDGVPSSYLSHNTTDTTPTKTDAQNWFGECSQVNSSGVTAGTWGPITHTYAASFTGPITLCPIMYDPHGGHENSGQSSVKDITAGTNASSKGYNGDNSYETNQFTGGPGSCPKISIPTLTTTASSAQAPNAIHDTATLSNTGGQSGSITFKLYSSGAACNGTPLFTSTVSTSGDGDYQSGDYSPTSVGTYQWQASYSSSSIKGLITPCNDPNERSPVTPPNHRPKGMSVLKFASVRCADLATPLTTWQPAGAQTCSGTWSNYLPESAGEMIISLRSSGSFAIPINYKIQVTNTGKVPLKLSLKDRHCDSGSIAGPFQGNSPLSGRLRPGQQAYFTCTHVLTLSDDPSRHASFTNVGVVTGRPPTGPPLRGRSHVTVKTQHPGAKRFCRSTTTGKKIRWRKGTRKPRACRVHPRPPKHPQGFTG